MNEHWNNKRMFDANQIRAIRRRFWTTSEGTGTIARRFGVSRATIRNIVERRTYRDIAPIPGEQATTGATRGINQG